MVKSIGDATTNVISSAGGAVENTATGFGKIFHEIFGGIGGTTKWILLLGILILILYFGRHHLTAPVRKQAQI